MPATFTQWQLRRAFARWGLPHRVRVDNGAPWGSAGDLPTELALWIVGLGPGMIWNPPRCPQANGVVEHSQGTGKRWAEPKTCRDADELQRRLEQQDGIQRERYPSIAGKSRMAAFPGLAHSGRGYQEQEEEQQWRLEPVLIHLADYEVVRRVDVSGSISLYNRNRHVGKKLSGREVYISLDPLSVEWVYAGSEGTCYRREKAQELTSERIRSLSVSNHRTRGR